MPGRCCFDPAWLKEEQLNFKDWLKNVDDDVHTAHCSCCKKTFTLGNMGHPVENEKVISRAIDTWDNIIKYVDCVERKVTSHPHNKSYDLFIASCTICV